MDRPIKAHLNEEMRSHIEFCLCRYRNELENWIARKHQTGNVTDFLKELRLTLDCIEEMQQAGT